MSEGGYPKGERHSMKIIVDGTERLPHLKVFIRGENDISCK